MDAIRDMQEGLKQELLDSVVLTPNSSEYPGSLKRWSEAAEKKAGLIVIPQTDQDISKVVQFAQKSGIDLAVVGGGHATSGSSSTQGGILIDLSKMRQVTVDRLNRTVTAQGGALWEDVDKAAGEHGLATVGGVVNHTGVGGLTLGGGYGWLTGQYGLVIDNLISAKIVTSDGHVLKASSKENSDLFWAIRGAGHNFGVMTEVTIQAYEQINMVYAGLLGFTPDKLEQVIKFADTLLQDDGSDGRSGIYCFIAVPPGGTEPTILTAVVSNTSEEEAKQRFAPLFNLDPIMNTISMIPYHQVNALLNDIAVHGDRKSMKGFSFSLPLRPELARTVLDELARIIKSEPDLLKSFVVFEFLNLDKVAAVPCTATSFAKRGRCPNGSVWMWWTDSKNDSKAREQARRLNDIITAELERGMAVPGDVAVYSNFVETGDRSVQELFGDNMERLKNLKAKYDPNNIFNKTHPII